MITICGIAGFHIKDPTYIRSHDGLEAFVDRLLLGIESRGKHATGFVASTFSKDGNPKHRSIVMDKGAVTASAFIKTRDRIPLNVQTVLLHTRWWTKGDPSFYVNNHPVIHKTCFAVHNGQINNDDELFEKYNLDRAGQVDSEIIPALAYKIGFDTPAEFMNKFRGSIATALIDPVNFPGRLILAKGRLSPICVFDNPRFMVWASEVSAIREAWAEVIGTPPKHNKIQHMRDGNIWIYDDATKSEETFTLPSYVTNPVSVAAAWGGHAHTDHYRGRDAENQQRTDSKAASDPDARDIQRIISVRKAVREAREEHQQHPELGTWLVCPVMHLVTEEQKEGLFGDKSNNKDMITWVACPCCMHNVEKSFMHEITVRWGTICEDCYQATIIHYRATAALATEEASKDNDKDAPEAPVEWLDKKVVETLDRFVSAEAEIHRLALVAVSKETNIPLDIVEWIIFRIPESYLARHALMSDVQEDFDTMYQEYVDHLWEEKEGDRDDEVQELRGFNVDEEKSESRSLMHCEHHDWWGLRSEGCPDCLLDTECKEAANSCGLPSVGGVVIESSLARRTPEATETQTRKCECGRFMRAQVDNPADTKCFFCRGKARTTPTTQLELVPGPQAVGEPPTALTIKSAIPAACVGGGGTCASAVEFYIPNHPQGFGWCVDHFIGCECQTDKGKKCEALSNHTRPDGIRVCHHHSRSVSGVVSDTVVEKEFGEFMELGRY